MACLRNENDSLNLMQQALPLKSPEIIEKLAAKFPSETITKPSLRLV